ncbi:unnamed protein product [Hymenolepis diminuta]|uniref:WD_REPEATS_REGION domain-containing protein n=1 Tax=Hymenolepis diminuta TaxID=6216 RepID=A0A0R3S9I1_HYMDI|nr:unnamed protein product [Hymenolepis diminuta]
MIFPPPVIAKCPRFTLQVPQVPVKQTFTIKTIKTNSACECCLALSCPDQSADASRANEQVTLTIRGRGGGGEGRLTCGYLAVSGSWLSVGSDQGNVHFVNVQQFNTSGYVINWNRAINVTQSQRPGSVVQLAEHPQNSNKLLIGYSSGLLVLWDLRAKAAEARFHYLEVISV